MKKQPYSFRPAPPSLMVKAMGSSESRQWFDRIARCSASVAKTIEVRKVAANEVPLVLASLVLALSDHSRIPKEKILEMVSVGVDQLSMEAPEHPPGELTNGTDRTHGLNTEGHAS